MVRKKGRKPKCVEVLQPDPNELCTLCRKTKLDGNELQQAGKFYKFGEKFYHYFCLLYCRNIDQKASDHLGLLGFLKPDIDAACLAVSKIDCHFCHEPGAGCFCRQCNLSYHFTCGYENGCTFLCIGEMPSCCPNHAPVQRKIQLKIQDRTCLAGCQEIVEKKDKFMISPCCGRIFHLECLQNMAFASGGYHYKCPCCSDKQSFPTTSKNLGIYIPEKDAEWENPTEDAFYAFGEMAQPYQHCDAQKCVCPQGRKYHLNASDFEIIRCDQCGCKAVHIKCGKLVKKSPFYVCDQHDNAKEEMSCHIKSTNNGCKGKKRLPAVSKGENPVEESSDEEEQTFSSTDDEEKFSSDTSSSRDPGFVATEVSGSVSSDSDYSDLGLSRKRAKRNLRSAKTARSKQKNDTSQNDKPKIDKQKVAPQRVSKSALSRRKVAKTNDSEFDNMMQLEHTSHALGPSENRQHSYVLSNSTYDNTVTNSDNSPSHDYSPMWQTLSNYDDSSVNQTFFNPHNTTASQTLSNYPNLSTQQTFSNTQQTVLNPHNSSACQTLSNSCNSPTYQSLQLDSINSSACLTANRFNSPACPTANPFNSSACQMSNGHNSSACQMSNGHNSSECEMSNGHNSSACQMSNGHNSSACQMSNGHNSSACLTLSNAHNSNACQMPNGHNSSACLTLSNAHNSNANQTITNFRENSPKCLTALPYTTPPPLMSNALSYEITKSTSVSGVQETLITISSSDSESDSGPEPEFSENLLEKNSLCQVQKKRLKLDQKYKQLKDELDIIFNRKPNLPVRLIDEVSNTCSLTFLNKKTGRKIPLMNNMDAGWFSRSNYLPGSNNFFDPQPTDETPKIGSTSSVKQNMDILKQLQNDGEENDEVVAVYSPPLIDLT